MFSAVPLLTQTCQTIRHKESASRHTGDARSDISRQQSAVCGTMPALLMHADQVAVRCSRPLSCSRISNDSRSWLNSLPKSDVLKYSFESEGNAGSVVIRPSVTTPDRIAAAAAEQEITAGLEKMET